jgi:hypothetical protein
MVGVAVGGAVGATVGVSSTWATAVAVGSGVAVGLAELQAARVRTIGRRSVAASRPQRRFVVTIFKARSPSR